MRSARYALSILVGLLFSVSGIADDTGDPVDEEQPSAAVALSTRLPISVSGQASRWQSLADADSTSPQNPASQTVVNLHFEDSGAFARARKIRAVSLLTLAEVNGARLFFGVNRKGVLGLHVRAVAPHGDDSCPELARMPYLADIGAVSYTR